MRPHETGAGRNVIWAGAIALAGASLGLGAPELPGHDPSPGNPVELVRLWFGMKLEERTRVVNGRPRVHIAVQELRAGGAAAKAGFEPGDIVVFVNDQFVRSIHDVARILSPVEAASMVPVDVLRAGRPVMLCVRYPGM